MSVDEGGRAAGLAAPMALTDRAPAPDVARGVALLGIALANGVTQISGRGQLGPSFRPVDGTPADRVVDVVVGLLVDNRAFPMFTLLLAHGFVVLARRQAERGASWSQTRLLLLRRTSWLAAFGAAHLLLLFSADILLVYGILGFALIPLVRARTRRLVVVAALGLLPYLAFHGVDGMPGSVAGPGSWAPFGTGTYLGGLATRAFTVGAYVVMAPLVVLVFITPAVIGILLARARVLERPEEHLPLLRRLTVAGFALSVPGAVPMVLASVQVLPVGVADGYLLGVLQAGTGLAGAVAFAALVGWLVGTHRQRRWRIATAVGQRSLTCYLLQSVVMVPLLAPWGAGLGVGAGTAFVAVLSVLTYAVTAGVAVVLDQAGRPGPAEVLLRRLVYR